MDGSLCESRDGCLVQRVASGVGGVDGWAVLSWCGRRADGGSVCFSGEPGDERDVHVADAFDGAEQQPVAAADFRGAGEVPGAVVAFVRAQAAACAGRPCAAAACGAEAAGGRVGDHAGTEVGRPVRHWAHLKRQRGSVMWAVRFGVGGAVTCRAVTCVVCRYEYLSNAVLQARSGSRAPGGLGLSSELSDSGLMELLEGKLAVLRFQVKIKEALERVASGGSGEQGGNAPMEEDGFPYPRAFSGGLVDESRVQAAREKSEELSTELKSITQLYNDYACRFELWEVSESRTW